MSNSLFAELATLTSSEVVAGLQHEVRAERAATAWLAEMERRRLYVS